MNVLVVFLKDSSFVREDIRLLSKSFDVTSFHFQLKLGKIYSLFRAIRKSDVVFLWFASYHAFITTILTRFVQRPVIVVTGGYDVACVPEIHYGLALKRTTRAMVKYVLKRATRIISVSNFNKRELQNNYNIDTSIVVPNARDVEKFYPSGQKEDLVTTVCYINWKNVKVKGLCSFLLVAKELPDLQFAIIGNGPDDVVDYLRARAPKNVVIPGRVSDEEILHYYQKTKVYCQLSFYESFGVAVVESMLCECVPVVTNIAALSEVVGTTGFLIEYDNVDDIAKKIKEARISDKGKKARERAIVYYNTKDREISLKQLVMDAKNAKMEQR